MEPLRRAGGRGRGALRGLPRALRAGPRAHGAREGPGLAGDKQTDVQAQEEAATAWSRSAAPVDAGGEHFVDFLGPFALVRALTALAKGLGSLENDQLDECLERVRRWRPSELMDGLHKGKKIKEIK